MIISLWDDVDFDIFEKKLAIWRRALSVHPRIIGSPGRGSVVFICSSKMAQKSPSKRGPKRVPSDHLWFKMMKNSSKNCGSKWVPPNHLWSQIGENTGKKQTISTVKNIPNRQKWQKWPKWRNLLPYHVDQKYMMFTWTWRSEHRTAVWLGGYTFRPPRFFQPVLFQFWNDGHSFFSKMRDSIRFQRNNRFFHFAGWKLGMV